MADARMRVEAIAENIFMLLAPGSSATVWLSGANPSPLAGEGGRAKRGRMRGIERSEMAPWCAAHFQMLHSRMGL